MLDLLQKKYINLPTVLKASIWFFICSFLQKGISLLTTPIFTRLMSTSEFGFFNIYLSWSEFLNIFISLGLSGSVYQKKLVQLNNNDEAVFTSSFQGLATFCAFFTLLIYLIFKRQLNRIFGLPTEYVLTIFASTLVSTAFGFWILRERARYSYINLVIVTLIVTFLKPLFGIISILLFPNTKVSARIYSMVFVDVAVYSYFYVSQFLRGKTFFNKKYWKYAVCFALPLIPHYISQRVLSQSDKIMINYLVGTSEAGIYSLAHSVGWILNIIVLSLDTTLAPWTYNKLRERDYDSLQKFTIIPVIGMALVCLIFLAITPEMVYLFAPIEYCDAIDMIPPFVLSTFLILIYTLFLYIEYYFENTKMIMIATTSVAALNILLNYFFISKFGYMAAAYTTLFCYFIYSSIHYFVYSKICKKNIGIKIYNVKLIIIITVVLSFLSFSFYNMYAYPVFRYSILALLTIFIVIFRKKLISYFIIFK